MIAKNKTTLRIFSCILVLCILVIIAVLSAVFQSKSMPSSATDLQIDGRGNIRDVRIVIEALPEFDTSTVLRPSSPIATSQINQLLREADHESSPVNWKVALYLLGYDEKITFYYDGLAGTSIYFRVNSQYYKARTTREDFVTLLMYHWTKSE